MRVMFLVHHEADSVGVAVNDIPAGSAVPGKFRDGSGDFQITTVNEVPLGHKLALHDIADGDEIIEYGVAVGRATQAVARGERVHTHNMKGQRWA